MTIMISRNRAPVQHRATSSLAALALCAAALMSNAQAAPCPASNFDDFFKTLQDRPEIRMNHTRKPLTLQWVEMQGDQPHVKNSAAADPARELQGVFALQKSKGLKATVERPDRVIFRDENGESLVILIFEQKNCWTLNRIEDWSLGQQLYTTSAADPAAIAIKRGDLYIRIAGETPSNSLIALYASALDNYLYGASLGSAKAAYAAAGISLSGQAPQLPTPRMQNLLEIAAKAIPEAGITLAYFYCDEGESGSNLPCANPDKALQALKDIARLDLKTALVELGNAYATGHIAAPNTSQALACFLEAQSMGATGLDNTIENLKAKGSIAQSAAHCL